MGIKDSNKDLADKIVEGLKEVKRKLTLFKKEKNSPLIVSKDGKVVEIEPENIEKEEGNSKSK